MININDYQRRLNEYRSGKLSTSQFRTFYQSVRAVINARIASLDKLDLDSEPLEDIMALNYYTTGDPLKVGAFSKVSDPEYMYERMLSFLRSPFSAKSTYRKGVKIMDDLLKSAYENQHKEYDDKISAELTKFIAMGGLKLLKNIFGNSFEALEEAEKRINEGITAEDLIEAAIKYAAGVMGYDEALEEARERKRKREEAAKNFKGNG